MSEPAGHTPLGAERLKALGHPLRIQLLNALSTYGPATASGLAERFGESSGVTSYHLRQLAKHGFVREDTERGNARDRWWVRVPGAIALDPRAFPPESAERAAAETVLGEWHREQVRLLGDFLRYGVETESEEWGDATLLTSSNLSLTVEQLKALGEELDAVLQPYIERYRGQTGPGTRRVRIDLNAFPITDRKGVEG